MIKATNLPDMTIYHFSTNKVTGDHSHQNNIDSCDGRKVNGMDGL